ncbi:hypothetical protein H4R26_000260 [Coemansia thaxteri]|uniref:Uncharacterized protein n=1 Tax=Coemansia thaxteri TaxID=2663907 RepID=A0A9W8BH69_9FUNG|nr:hypothetical protein H4R26_000260 [Coemansia thaxteri]KAJ2487750.1 hypothetical protein EV174_000353 [Coemansia sp. RSA 2320]
MDEAEAQPAEGPPGATPALPPQRLDDSALPAAEDSNSSSGGGAAAEVAEAVEPNAEADVIQQHPAIVVPTSTPEAVEAAEVATGTHNDDNSGNSGELHGPAASISSYASSSSLYAGSASLVGMGGIVASLAGVSGNASIAGGLAPTVVGGGGGTLSPPHTLVNSDGASMRVHTGSIRERNFNRRISAIHEDDSDVYSESRRSDSLIFSHYHTQQQQQPQQQQTLQQSRPSGSLHRQGSYHTAYHCARRRRCRRRLSDDDANVMSRVLSESDCFSVVSGISEGGASTTRVRLATDRAYDALRAGASASAAANAVAAAASLGLGYHFNFSGGGSSGQYHYRATSFATSSDPGLPNTGSFYDYYLDPNDYAPNSGSARDDEDGNMDSDVVSECSHTHHRCYRQDEDIVSLIRSDIAVYGSAADDIKFPFLPDNFSEFSGSVVYSPSGAFATSADYADHRRVSRDNSETYYHVPSHHHHHHYQDQPPPPQLSQPLPQLPSSDNSRKDKKSRRGKDRLITRNNGKARDSLPSSATAAAANGTASSQIRNGTPARAVRPAAGPSGPSGPVSRSSRHYRRQSASEAYPTSATAVTVVAVTNASPAASSAIRQSNRTAANSPAIRPNALMRFFKRITPKT